MDPGLSVSAHGKARDEVRVALEVVPAKLGEDELIRHEDLAL
jgi:hypothetical protein